MGAFTCFPLEPVDGEQCPGVYSGTGQGRVGHSLDSLWPNASQGPARETLEPEVVRAWPIQHSPGCPELPGNGHLILKWRSSSLTPCSVRESTTGLQHPYQVTTSLW